MCRLIVDVSGRGPNTEPKPDSKSIKKKQQKSRKCDDEIQRKTNKGHLTSVEGEVEAEREREGRREAAGVVFIKCGQANASLSLALPP